MLKPSPEEITAFRGNKWACSVMKLLIVRDDVNIEIENVFGHTPLYWASRNGYEEIQTLLIDRGCIVPNFKNKDSLRNNSTNEALIELGHLME